MLNTSPQPSEPMFIAEKSKSIWPVILITVVITALLVGGGVYALQTISANKKIKNLEKEIKTLQDQIGQKTDNSQQKIVEENNTANWQTYKNGNYGFEFKYSKELEPVSFSDQKFYFGGAFPGVDASWVLKMGNLMEKNCYDTLGKYPFYIDGYLINATQKTDWIKKLLANDLSVSLTTSLKDEKINDSRVIWYRERGEGQECSNLHALVFNNNQAVRFTSLNNDESKIKELIENFKFLGNEGDYEPQAYIQDGNVYYVNESGEKIKITESITNPKNPVDVQNYKTVLLSPNNKFIALISLGWEIIGVEVYDIQNKKMYQANEAGNNLSWLPDNRLKLIAECGMGISCGVYESEDNLKPWIFKKVANINF